MKRFLPAVLGILLSLPAAAANDFTPPVPEIKWKKGEPLPPDPNVEAIEARKRLVIETVKPGTVTITVKVRTDKKIERPTALGGKEFVDSPESVATGTGFIIDAAKGYIVTNSHVVDGIGRGGKISAAERGAGPGDAPILKTYNVLSSLVVVTLHDGNKFPAQVIDFSPEGDLALLKIAPRAYGKPLTALMRCSDPRAAKPGNFVIAIGSPYNIQGTSTAGMISNVGMSIGSIPDAIQTDAAINHGNSGGPLVTFRACVIGVNFSIISPNGGSVGLGFAIPIERAAALVERYQKGLPLHSARAGMLIKDAEPEGVLVQDVFPDSPAALGGVLKGDLILRVDGAPVVADERSRATEMLVSWIGSKAPGSTVKLTVQRGASAAPLVLDVRPQ